MVAVAADADIAKPPAGGAWMRDMVVPPEMEMVCVAVLVPDTAIELPPRRKRF